MQLEDYWGVGPKTRETLVDSVGEATAIQAIKEGDIRTVTQAGVDEGRATQIIRRAHGGEALELLATRDARTVYNDLIALAQEFAVTEHARDRIRVLTPLRSHEAMEARLDNVLSAADSWDHLDEERREALLQAFEEYDSVGGDERSAVELAITLNEIGVSAGVFADIAELDTSPLQDALSALGHLEDGNVVEGADDRLAQLRASAAAIDRLEGQAFDVLDELREEGLDERSMEDLRRSVVAYLDRETEIDVDTIRRATPDDAADSADFVGTTLRQLADTVQEQVEEREATVTAEIQETLEAVREEIDAAVTAVEHLTLHVSLARFARAFDLIRPTFVESDTIAVENARNLGLEAQPDETVQPVTYAVGEHDLDVPSGQRVAVLTGANSGGKTTLLETLCQVSILAQMGLPVPAERATVGLVDSVVFHRRHASFNAGVLESTLQAIVPPVASEGHTLMLVDEFEAITEPGSAADLLHALVTLTVDRQAIGVYVTHLADELRPLPDTARIDGIFARGLDEDLTIDVDYQPAFGEMGQSTPEFIVARLIQDATTREERVGFDHLAAALDEDERQGTLADVEWTSDENTTSG